MNNYFAKDIKRRQDEIDKWFLQMQNTSPLSAEVQIDRDIAYINDDKNCHKMDVYYTTFSNELKPAIFNFHGGGLLTCDRSVNQWFCSEMAKRGFVVFCIDYPLVPQVDIYTILKDSYIGITKAYSLLEQYKCDKNRVFLCGDSAGGFITTYIAAIQNNPVIAESLNISLKEMHFHGLATIGGMFYSSKIDKHLMFILRKDFYGKDYKSHPFWKFVNPEQSAIIENLPPAIFITAKKDFLRDYTIRFTKALRKYNKSFILLDYQKNKALEHDFVCLMPNEKDSLDAMDKLAEFLVKIKNH